MDTVAYINGVRSAGFCRPWTYSLNLLNIAYEDLKDENQNYHENKNESEIYHENENEKSGGIYPVINTVITNLKYMEQDRSQRESGGAVVKAQEVLRWMLERNIPPSTLIMVSTYVLRLFYALVLHYPYFNPSSFLSSSLLPYLHPPYPPFLPITLSPSLPPSLLPSSSSLLHLMLLELHAGCHMCARHLFRSRACVGADEHTHSTA